MLEITDLMMNSQTVLRPAAIDSHLLKDENTEMMGTNMLEHLRLKTSEAQLATSKRVIKRFWKNPKCEDKTEQTEFKDGDTIRQLELQLDLSKRKNDKAAMREKVLLT